MYTHTRYRMCVRLHVSHHKLWKREKKCRPQNGSPLFIFLLHLVALVTHSYTYRQQEKRRRKFGFNWSG